MNIHFTCRHAKLSKDLRSFVEGKLERLDRFLDEDSDVHVILAVEKHRHEAEMIIGSRHGRFTGSAITSDLHSSVSLVTDKMEKQLRRQKRQLTDRRRRAARGTRRPGTGADGSGQDGRTLLPEPQAAKPMSVEEAAMDLEHSPRDFLVFRNSESDRMSVVYRREDGAIGLIEAS